MSFEQRFRSWKNGCLRKKRYDSMGFAEKVAKRRMKRGGVSLSWYQCQWCKGWHLTSRRA